MAAIQGQKPLGSTEGVESSAHTPAGPRETEAGVPTATGAGLRGGGRREGRRAGMRGAQPPRLVDTEKARPRSHGARAGTGAGLLVLPRPRLHLHLCQLGMPLRVGEASRAECTSLSPSCAHTLHGSVGAEAP